MLRKRLITVLTFNNGVLFRTRNFIPDYRYTVNFVDLWSIDEMVILDISRPGEGDRENFYEILKDISKKCFVPLTVGGGISTIDEINKLLNMGADKVVINREALDRPEFITEASKLFGSQCIVASIDSQKNAFGDYKVYQHFGKEETVFCPAEWAKRLRNLGAGEILITSISRDGTLEGYDNVLNRIVADAVDIPVLVCGGAGKWQDFVDGFVEGKASAVCTTNIYHFTDSSIKSAKKYLISSDILVRV